MCSSDLIGDISDNFDYYVLGHLHKYINDDFGEGKLVYPGSSEIWKTDELKEYKEKGKGFVVVDLDGAKPRIKRVKIDIPREFINRSLDFKNLESGIEGIKETIKDFDKKPILNLTIKDVDSDVASVYEKINEELGDLSLMIRPEFKMIGEDNIDDIIIQSDSLGPKELIVDKLKEFDNENVTKLAIDLYEYLSKDKLYESEELINQFFHEHYRSSENVVEDENTPKEDVQVTFKEVLE